MKRSIKSNGTDAFTMVEAMLVALMMAVLSGVVYRSLVTTMWQLRSTKLQTAAIQQSQQQAEALRGMDYYRIWSRASDNVAYINYDVVEGDSYNASEDVLLTNTVVIMPGSDAGGADVTADMVTYAWCVDDAYDGVGGADSRGDTCDYKQIRVQTTWSYQGRSYTSACDTFVYGMNWSDSGLDDDWRLRVLDLPAGQPQPPADDVPIDKDK